MENAGQTDVKERRREKSGNKELAGEHLGEVLIRDRDRHGRNRRLLRYKQRRRIGTRETEKQKQRKQELDSCIRPIF